MYNQYMKSKRVKTNYYDKYILLILGDLQNSTMVHIHYNTSSMING